MRTSDPAFHDALFALRVFAKRAGCTKMPKVRLIFETPAELHTFEALLRSSLSVEEIGQQGIDNAYRPRSYKLVGTDVLLLLRDH